MNSSIFSNTSYTDGKIGIGLIPYYLLSDISILSAYYYNTIPDKTKTTHHTYFRDIDPIMYPVFDKIQRDPFWRLCENPSCIQFPVTQMNELYFSNPKPNFQNMNLYGAAANLIPHRDCILFHFYDIQVYRIIIGLSDTINNDVATNFPNFNVTHKIQYGDYILFDFDRTIHQVIKTSNIPTQRILMKLHYIVCSRCHAYYIQTVSLFYRLYYWIARYTEQLGTDPTTFVGFFFGILWEFPFYPETKYGSITTGLSIFLYFSSKNRFKTKKSVIKTIQYLFLLYLGIVFWFYLRYLLFGIA